MKKGIITILLAAVLLAGCGDTLYSRTNPQRTVVEPEVNAEVLRITEIEKSETVQGPEAVQESEASQKSEVVEESEASQKSEVVEESEASQKSEVVEESETSQKSEVVEESETSQESETVQESETSQESEAASAHICRMDSGSTVTVLAFGEHEPDCFYGAKYDVKCVDCGKCLDVIYRGPLGHAGDEGVVTCQPDCTGGGSIRYTCIRCGAEWSETYGQVQPHTWVEGIRKETDWDNGGTKEVPYLYCNVCGKREGNE